MTMVMMMLSGMDGDDDDCDNGDGGDCDNGDGADARTLRSSSLRI